MEKIIEITFIVRFRYSEENTRKTWMTDFIIVCQNLIGWVFYLETIVVC